MSQPPAASYNGALGGSCQRATGLLRPTAERLHALHRPVQRGQT
jgi:hypothetical protein